MNHHQIPVNMPRGAMHTYNSFHRDGQMRVDGNHGTTLHYEPNSYNIWREQPEYDEPTQKVSGDIKRWNFREDDDNYYEQPGKLFRLITPRCTATVVRKYGAEYERSGRTYQNPPHR